MPHPKDELKKQFRHKVGMAIRRLRLERGLSQEDLAERIGIARNYQGKIERGEVFMTIWIVFLLSCGLKMTMSELMAQLENGHLDKT